MSFTIEFGPGWQTRVAPDGSITHYFVPEPYDGPKPQPCDEWPSGWVQVGATTDGAGQWHEAGSRGPGVTRTGWHGSLEMFARCNAAGCRSGS